MESKSWCCSRPKVGEMLCFNVLDSRRKQKQTSFLECKQVENLWILWQKRSINHHYILKTPVSIYFGKQNSYENWNQLFNFKCSKFWNVPVFKCSENWKILDKKKSSNWMRILTRKLTKASLNPWGSLLALIWGNLVLLSEMRSLNKWCPYKVTQKSTIEWELRENRPLL